MDSDPNEPAQLRLHAFVAHSRANGPGLRATLWVQGCTLDCPGCYNPETHSSQAGSWQSVAALAHQIVGLKDIEGLTISGGEPLQQARALAILAAEVRARSRLSIILFTGFEPSEIQRMPVAQELLGHCDVLIAGRFHQEQAIATDLRGSSNKQIIFLTDRYTPHDFTGLFPAEIWISPDGSLSMSGISPVKL